MSRAIITPVRWIFFDLGNTLIDETCARQDLLARIAERIQRFAAVSVRELEQRLAREFAGFAPDPWKSVLSNILGDEAAACHLLEELPYPKHLEKPYPEVLQVVSHLANVGFQLGVIANQSCGTDVRLDTYGMSRFFSACFTSAELGMAKPDPAIFLLAARRTGCRANAIMMVGDRIDNDIRPTRLLGWKTIRVRRGLAAVQQPRDLFDEAEQTCSNLREALLNAGCERAKNSCDI